ncbi:MAG: ferritin-like domain-containing protein [Novosphingobium sp.]|nr:ferritin-like domain-containing protein [Novosphingobium sp.]
MSEPSVASAIQAALLTADPFAKVRATRDVARRWRRGDLACAFEVPMPDRPARPARPELLAFKAMPKRGRGQSLRGRIALLHALAHIEFVAIDLALDMAGRFGGTMGEAFVGDWLAVAADEAMHFALLARRLAALGSAYGDLPAHDGLWEAAEATRHDVAARLAIVPMVLEARGLDVTPATIERMRFAGDEASARILERIFSDEIRHVRCGTAWFGTVCQTRGSNPAATWQTLVEKHFRGGLKPPFNDSARQAAGLPREFYAGIAL